MKPVILRNDMVRAVLEGRKTTARLPVKENGWEVTGRPKWANDSAWKKDGFFFDVCKVGEKEGPKTATCHLIKPPYNVEDVLWIRESWAEMPYGYVYRADGEEPEGWDVDDRWGSPVSMPRDVARIFLRVTDVRAERLQDITEDGAKAEGAEKSYPYTDPDTGKTAFMLHDKGTYRSGFSQIWDDAVPKHPNKFKRYPYYWKDNPWVWVIAFERINRGK